MYEGDWCDDKPDGKGKLTHPDGDVYEGDWKNGIFQGRMVRAAAVSDLVKIMRIENESVLESGRFTNAQHEALREYTDVLEVAGAVVGFVTTVMLDNKRHMRAFRAAELYLGQPEGPKKGVLLVVNIAVAQGMRAHGHGSCLVEHALRKHAGNRMVRYTAPPIAVEHVVGKVCRKRHNYECHGRPVKEGRYGDGDHMIAFRHVLKRQRA